MYDLIIVGGGPAGVTAGIYAARQKLNTLLITKEFGGQMMGKAVAIKNYPGFEEISALELIQKFEKHLRKQEINIEQAEVTKLKKIGKKFSVFTKDKKRFESKAVIISSGADPRALEIPGEKEFIGRGVSYCVTCDGPLFSNKNVVVIGGGNSGFEAAIFLEKIAKIIYILEYGEKIKADIENQEKVQRMDKIQIITNAAAKEIQGGQFVSNLIYTARATEKDINLPIEGVFVEVGSHPATSFVKNLVRFNHFVNRLDEIAINPRTCETHTPGLFAAGDVSDIRYKQIVVAAGEGAKAALSVFNYLQKEKI